MQPGPIGRDIWNYLYTATDSAWRKLHLKSCLVVYYNSLFPYLKMAGIEMNFEEVLQEVNEYMQFGFIMSHLALPIILNPNPDQNMFKSFGELKKFFNWRNEMFSKPIHDNEHDLIKEANRRLIENVIEAYELGILK